MGIKIRSVDFVPPHIHKDIIEIIFCLKGSVQFDYSYEVFTLNEGEFISVDKDAHYLYAGSDDICVSFYIDLKKYEKKYPYVTGMLFVCEAVATSTAPHTKAQDELRGILVSLLFYLGNHSDDDHQEVIKTINKSVDRMIKLFIEKFDISYYWRPELDRRPEVMKRSRLIMDYIEKNCTEKLTINDIANKFNITPSYVSEFLSSVGVGFREGLGYFRANKSEEFLLYTDLNIAEISQICGFSDSKYYYDKFKKWYKCTPREFRKNYKTKMNRPCKETNLDIEDTYQYLDGIMLKHYLKMFL